MKRLLVLLILLIALPAYSQQCSEDTQMARLTPAMMGSVPVAGCGAGTELICEDFDSGGGPIGDCGDSSHTNCNETWSWDTTQPENWDFNYATSPAPLDGTYSLYANDTTNDGIGYWKTFTAQDTVYFFLMINKPATATAEDYFYIMDSVGNPLLGLYNSGPEFGMNCGTVSGYSVGSTMAVNTTYYLWGDYTKGTGENAVCHLYHSIDGTKGAADITISNGNATAQASLLVLFQELHTTHSTIYDHIRVGTSAFGDNPP